MSGTLRTVEFRLWHVIDRPGQSIGSRTPAGPRERGMSKRTTAAVWLRGITEMLTAEGIDAKAVFAGAGIDPALVEAPGARIPTEKLSRLWEVAVERSGNPSIGLAQHQVAKPPSFDVVGYTMMSCP